MQQYNSIAVESRTREREYLSYHHKNIVKIDVSVGKHIRTMDGYSVYQWESVQLFLSNTLLSAKKEWSTDAHSSARMFGTTHMWWLVGCCKRENAPPSAPVFVEEAPYTMPLIRAWRIALTHMEQGSRVVTRILSVMR